MGSLISPVLADIFMENFELQALSSPFSPCLWRRYVHYTFKIIHARYLSPFLEHLNSIRPGIIKFTNETNRGGEAIFECIGHQE